MLRVFFTAMALACLILTGVSAQGTFESLEIPFNQELIIVREGLENSAEELLLTLLFTSDPEISSNPDAEICEFESSEIEAPIRDFYQQDMTGSVPAPVDTGECDAVRIHYRYAPSPIPADAKLIFAQLNLGQPTLEFIYSDPSYFESAGADGVPAERLTQRRSELTISPSFFGADGAQVYEAIPETSALQVTDWSPATRDRYWISLDDVLFGSTQLKMDVIASRQYVHRAFSEMDWNMVGNDKSVETVEPEMRFLLNGKIIGGTGSGGDGRFADEEQFDGPIHVDRYSMAFSHVGLMTETADTRLYQMNWVFYSKPKLRFAFTSDGKAIYNWTTELNYRPAFRVDFPGIEHVRIPDRDDPHRNFSQ